MMELSTSERQVLLGLVTYPDHKDTEIAERLSMPNSTFASAKSRLLSMDYLTETYIPVYPRLGFELLATVYADFNPSVSTEERIANTRRTVEVYPEMLLSIGESHRGFSISVAENITRIMRISLERMMILADLNLLEIELPIEVYFPFEMSNVHRFFNLAPFLHTRMMEGDEKEIADLDIGRDELLRKDRLMDVDKDRIVRKPEDVDLNKKQLEIMYYVLKNPSLSSSKLALKVPYSRHTISRVMSMLVEEGYISFLRVPDMGKLDSSMLSLFHVKVDPKSPITSDVCKEHELLQDDTVFFVTRPTEMMMVAVYQNYARYTKWMTTFNQFLKSHGYMNKIPNVRNHSLAEAIWIKKFVNHPLIKETFGLNVH